MQIPNKVVFEVLRQSTAGGVLVALDLLGT